MGGLLSDSVCETYGRERTLEAMHYCQTLSLNSANMLNPVEDYLGQNGVRVYGERKESEKTNDDKYKHTKDRFSDMSGAFAVLLTHDGIIDADTWMKCQKKLDTNKQIARPSKNDKTWLAGLMRCDLCKYTIYFIAKKDRPNISIQCRGRRQHSCDGIGKGWKFRDVEAAVEKRLLAYLKERSKLGKKPAKSGYSLRALLTI